MNNLNLTAAELTTLSNALITAISRAVEADRLVASPASHDAIAEEIRGYRLLNDKITGALIDMGTTE